MAIQKLLSKRARLSTEDLSVYVGHISSSKNGFPDTGYKGVKIIITYYSSDQARMDELTRDMLEGVAELEAREERE